MALGDAFRIIAIIVFRHKPELTKKQGISTLLHFILNCNARGSQHFVYPASENYIFLKGYRHIVLLSHPNHAVGVYEIRNLLRYGIATKSRMESSHRRYVYTVARDGIRLQRFHTMRKRIDSMPSLRLG